MALEEGKKSITHVGECTRGRWNLYTRICCTVTCTAPCDHVLLPREDISFACFIYFYINVVKSNLFCKRIKSQI
jgi:hypothetical protein